MTQPAQAPEGARPGLERRSVLVYPDPWAAKTNPYTRLVFDAMKPLGGAPRAFRPLAPWASAPWASADVLHVQWPESLLYERPVRRSALAARLVFANALAAARRVRRRGGAVVWTVHNAHPHDAAPQRLRAAWEAFTADFYALVDAVVCLSPSSEREVRRTFDQVAAARAAVIPHPHYRSVYGDGGGREAARRALGVEPGERLIASLGLIRRYKRLPELIARFVQTAGAGERLIVGGAVHDAALRREVERAAEGAPGVMLVTDDIPDARLAAIYAAADAAVFYSQGILNSGSVIAALSLGCPVVAVDCGALRDLQALVGGDWLSLIPEAATADELKAALHRLPPRTPARAPDLAAMEPARVAAEHLALYAELLRERGAPRSGGRRP